MFFKGATHAHLWKISKTHNRKRIPLLNLLINYLSARSAPHILSIKDECTFRFPNFLVIGLCKSYANSWFDIFSFLITPPEADLSRVAHLAKVFDRAREVGKWTSYQKIHKPLKQDPFYIHHISDFLNIKCFYTQHFIRSYSSGYIFKISTYHVESKLYLARFDKCILNLLFL